MVKWLICLSVLTLHGFEKLDKKYCIQYGNPKALIQIVEYFSFSCPKCIDFWVKEFPSIREKYLNTDKISWIFHPDPADLLTLQTIVCLEKLNEKEKIVFFEAVIKNLIDLKLKHGCLLMQSAMEVLGYPIPNLDNIDFLAETQAFKDAFKFLKQEDVIKIIPTLEIDGKICNEYPTADLVHKLIQKGSR